MVFGDRASDGKSGKRRTKPKYELGDIVRGYHGKTHGWATMLSVYKRFWPNTIATEYLERVSEAKRFDVLCDIAIQRSPDVDSQKLSMAKSDRVAVMHLRLMDVINGYAPNHESWATGDPSERQFFGQKMPSVAEFWEMGDDKWLAHFEKSPTWNPHYVASRYYFVEIIKALKKRHIHSIYILAAPKAKKEKWFSRTTQYLNLIRALFEAEGFTLNFSNAKSADEDFILGANARTFVRSGGGFSEIMQACAMRNDAYAPGASIWDFTASELRSKKRAVTDKVTALRHQKLFADGSSVSIMLYEVLVLLLPLLLFLLLIAWRWKRGKSDVHKRGRAK